MRASSFSILISFLVISIIGTFFLPLLPLKLSPSKQLPQANIYFNMYGNSGRVVEAEVTSKIESMVNRVKGIKGVSSTSGNGWGRVNVEIDKFSDMDVVRFELATTIRQLWPQLPAEVSYPNLEMNTVSRDNQRSFINYTINAPAGRRLIMQYVEDYIKPQLVNIKGLSNVNVWGAMPMEWQLRFDADILHNADITVDNISSAIREELNTSFLGIAPIQNENYIRLVLVPFLDKEPDWEKIQLTNKQGKVFNLSQLVKIQREEQSPTAYFRINGLNSIYINLYANPQSNQLDLGAEVEKCMANMKLPAGYEIHKIYDATEYIKEELDKIYFRSILTLIILLIFVLLISRRFKYLLLIVLSLITNLCIALILYYFLKIELQLYSLAGITVSMTLIIDNTIVMTDHLIHRKNFRAFPAILAATLTTMAALSVVFFLNEKVRLNLQDFSYVLIVNLGISLFIALFLVPALVERLGIDANKKRSSLNSKRRAVRFSRIYQKILQFFIRYKAISLILIVLIFGLPLFMLPNKLGEKTKWDKVYNATIGSEFYQKKLKNIAENLLGGSLRLFTQKVYATSHFVDKERKTLYVRAYAPNGTTLAQMNDVITEIEVYLSKFEEISQFETNINGARNASISISFKRAHENTGFPSVLKSKLITKAIELGSANWTITGADDNWFNNNVSESAGSFRIRLLGYNYEELTDWSEVLKKKLLENRRIKEVNISSSFNWYKDDYYEYEFVLNMEALIKNSISPYEVYGSLRTNRAKDQYVDRLFYQGRFEEIKLTAEQTKSYDIWTLQNKLFDINGKKFQMKQLAQIAKVAAPQQIVKENQQYLLCLQYDYIGSNEQGEKVLERTLEEFEKELPLGYRAESLSNYYYWDSKDNKQYLFLALIAVIIVFICSILFNSIRQAFSIISIIPISYIGVFLTFYLFKINFDQGGFASLVLLCGITVNASIYIVNEMNDIRKKKPKLSILRMYLAAWNAKLTPIFLTTVSTILGFIPFLIKPEAFWYPLAAGTIGGLLFSWIGIMLYLPLILIRKRRLPKPTL